jgi:signal transduction histidine kinase
MQSPRNRSRWVALERSASREAKAPDRDAHATLRKRDWRKSTRADMNEIVRMRNRWERWIGVERPLSVRVAATISIAVCGFGLTFLTYHATGFYFTSMVVVTVMLVALFAGTRIALAHAVAISLAADYFFIPPLGMVLTSAASWEHFAIIVSITTAVAMAASSMRTAFRDTIASRQHAERMLAVVSHDVRNPLSTVRLALQLSKDATPARQAELRATMLRNLDHADAMIQSLLDVASIRAGKTLPLAFRPCDLAVEVRAIVAENQVGGRIEIDAKEPIVGRWSVLGIRRALENLIANAVKYGAPDAPIEVRLERRGEHARLSVHNDGAPIPAASREKIFEAFERAGAPDDVAGWGLGLPLVRAIAEAHGGKIMLESAPRAGTTFTLDMPIS